MTAAIETVGAVGIGSSAVLGSNIVTLLMILGLGFGLVMVLNMAWNEWKMKQRRDAQAKGQMLQQTCRETKMKNQVPGSCNTSADKEAAAGGRNQSSQQSESRRSS